MNTGSVLETLKELRRWEQTTTALESRLRELRTLKSAIRTKLRSLELTLSAMDQGGQETARDPAGTGR